MWSPYNNFATSQRVCLNCQTTIPYSYAIKLAADVCSVCRKRYTTIREAYFDENRYHKYDDFAKWYLENHPNDKPSVIVKDFSYLKQLLTTRVSIFLTVLREIDQNTYMNLINHSFVFGKASIIQERLEHIYQKYGFGLPYVRYREFKYMPRQKFDPEPPPQNYKEIWKAHRRLDQVCFAVEQLLIDMYGSDVISTHQPIPWPLFDQDRSYVWDVIITHKPT